MKSFSVPLIFKAQKAAVFIAIGLCLMPLFAVFVPRFLGFAPALMALLGTGLYRVSTGAWPRISIFYAALAGGIFIISALSSIWSFDALDVLRQSASIFLILGFGAILFSLSRTMDQGAASPRALFEKVFPFTVVFGLLVIVIDLYASGLFYNLLHEPAAVFNSSRLNRGILTLVFMMVPALWVLQDGPYAGNIRRTLAAFLIALLAAVLYKTQSQTAQLAALVTLVFTVGFPYRAKGAWFILGAIIVAALLAAPWIAQAMFAHLASNMDKTDWLASAFAADRMEIWDFIARRALEQPFYGFGLEAASYIEKFDTQKLYAQQDHVLHPHNFAIQIWLEFGALGAVLASAAIGIVIKKIYNLGPDNARRVLPLFIAVLVAAATSYGLWQAWWLGVFTLLPVLCLLTFKRPAA